MARFGRQPVLIPQGVTVEVNGPVIKVNGPKGLLEKTFDDREVKIEIKDNEVLVLKKKDTKFSASMQGTIKSHITNMIKGVSEGWKKVLEISGAGYRVEMQGVDLKLSVGFSHFVFIKPFEGIKFSTEKNVITVEGIDKDKVGQMAANIRAVRKPEPYKGAGIKYQNEIVRRKAGKQLAKAGA